MVGRYSLSPNSVIMITLFCQTGGKPALACPAEGLVGLVGAPLLMETNC